VLSFISVHENSNALSISLLKSVVSFLAWPIVEFINVALILYNPGFFSLASLC